MKVQSRFCTNTMLAELPICRWLCMHWWACYFSPTVVWLIWHLDWDALQFYFAFLLFFTFATRRDVLFYFYFLYSNESIHKTDRTWDGKNKNLYIFFTYKLLLFSLLAILHFVNWDGHRHCTKSIMAITPFWFSTKHLWIVIALFWLSTDNFCILYNDTWEIGKCTLISRSYLGWELLIRILKPFMYLILNINLSYCFINTNFKNMSCFNCTFGQ